MGLLVILGSGAVPQQVWLSAIVIACMILCIAVLGTCLNKYHRRDDAHAAKMMRPGLLLGLYITLVMGTCMASAMLAGVTLTSVPATMAYILQVEAPHARPHAHLPTSPDISPSHLSL